MLAWAVIVLGLLRLLDVSERLMARGCILGKAASSRCWWAIVRCHSIVCRHLEAACQHSACKRETAWQDILAKSGC